MFFFRCGGSGIFCPQLDPPANTALVPAKHVQSPPEGGAGPEFHNGLPTYVTGSGAAAQSETIACHGIEREHLGRAEVPRRLYWSRCQNAAVGTPPAVDPLRPQERGHGAGRNQVPLRNIRPLTDLRSKQGSFGQHQSVAGPGLKIAAQPPYRARRHLGLCPVGHQPFGRATARDRPTIQRTDGGADDEIGFEQPGQHRPDARLPRSEHPSSRKHKRPTHLSISLNGSACHNGISAHAFRSCGLRASNRSNLRYGPER